MLHEPAHEAELLIAVKAVELDASAVVGVVRTMVIAVEGGLAYHAPVCAGGTRPGLKVEDHDWARDEEEVAAGALDALVHVDLTMPKDGTKC